MPRQSKNKYILVLVITMLIFAISWQASYLLNKKKFDDLKSAQDQISIDILSSETQFDLLREVSCEISPTSAFGAELTNLAQKIAYSEQNLATPEEIITMKKQYTLLEVRDFLLTKRVNERCKQNPPYIFYFYGTKDGCPDCQRQGYVLDALRKQHPEVRIYSFDYYLDLSTIDALKDIYKVGETLPALVISGTTYEGFKTLDQLLLLTK